jgi:hypothetical protein
MRPLPPCRGRRTLDVVSDPDPAFRLDGVETSLQRKGLAAKVGWTAAALTVAPFGIAIVLRALGLASRSTGAALGMMLLGAPVLALVALFLRRFRWKRPGSIAIEGGALVLERSGHDRRIPLGDLTAGHTSPLRRAVEIELRNGDLVHAHVPSVEDGQRLLEAAGLDAARRTMRMRLGETTFLDVISILLGPALVSPLVAVFSRMVKGIPGAVMLNPLLAILLTIALFRLVRGIFGPAELVIGADGIIVRQWWQARFVPFSQIESVDAASGPTPPVVINLIDGTAIQARTRHLSAAQREELAARIADARRAFEAGDAGGGAIARLDRHGRSAAAWREALRALSASAESYREQGGLDRDALVAVLESPAAPVERRIGAAVALAAGGDAEARARVRVAAEACANERVRIALARAAEDALDDEAIEAAVAAERAAR